MAYHYSDADQYSNYYQYQSHQYNQYHNNYNYNQYNEYQYNNYNHNYATSQTLALQPYCNYDNYNDGSNCYQVSNDYYSYGNFPVVYYSVAGSSQMERVELEGGGVSTDLIVDGEDDDEAYDDFDDYDPTPYDGGYDIVEVYGKPLPASDAICYPRSGTGSNDSEVRANVVSDQPVSNKAIVPVDDFECHNGNEQCESEFGSESESCCDSEMSKSDEKVSEDVKLSENEFIEEINYEGEREYEKVIVRNGDDAPKGDELSSKLPGFYDGLYGYLPCLNKKKYRTVVESGDYGLMGRPDDDPWKAAADFIFGSLNPYAD